MANITIKDIAVAAGVSPSTVSRVLTNNKAISKETRDRVLNIVSELNYVPNALARGLSNNRGNAVALLINNDNPESCDNLYFHKLIYGIESVLYKSEMYLIISDYHDTQISRDRVAKMIQGKLIQGIIVPSFLISKKLVEIFKQNNCPYVVIGEPEKKSSEFDWVDIDNEQAGSLAAKHLLEKKYNKIAFVAGKKSDIFIKNRIKGVCNVLNEEGIPFDESSIVECEDNANSAYTTISHLFQKSRYDAIICGDNAISIGVLKAIKEKQLHIPNDIGIITFDEPLVNELIDPALTYVDINLYEMGRESVRLLIRLIDNPNSARRTSLISTSVKFRESTNK